MLTMCQEISAIDCTERSKYSVARVVPTRRIHGKVVKIDTS